MKNKLLILREEKGRTNVKKLCLKEKCYEISRFCKANNFGGN